jgi:hypothetical protein
VDFNDSPRFEVLARGDAVILFDGEGNECEGKITAIRPAVRARHAVVVEAHADMSTWPDDQRSPQQDILDRMGDLHPLERIAELEDYLKECLGSYEALARLCASEQVRPLDQTMNWDGPTCARRGLGLAEKWEQRA